MIDGTYKIEIDTPLGHKQGTVTLRTSGAVAHADIDAPFIGKQRIEGRANGDSFTAEGTLKIMLAGKVDYSLKGAVSGDKVHIDIKSSKGSFMLSGTRV